VAAASFAGAGASFSYTFPAYSATVIKLTSTASCSTTIAPASQSFPAIGGDGSITVTTEAGCDWAAVVNDSWITLTSASTGSGNGVVTYSVRGNATTSPRQGTMTVGGQTFTVTQAGQSSGNCSYSISPTSKSFSSAGGTGTINVTTSAGCGWVAASNVSWITVTSGATGTGSGTVSYSVAPNSGAGRKGKITIGGQVFSIKQR
jgi:hypothetical protein